MMKVVVETDTHLPTTAYQSWIIEPWESNLEIDVAQDRKETQHDPETNEYYGSFTNWGSCRHTIDPSGEDKKIYVGINVKTPEGDRIELYIFEDESQLATWMTAPESFQGTPLLFKQRIGTFTADPDDDKDRELTRVWRALLAALRSQSLEGFKLLTDTNDLVKSADALQKDGYKLSQEAFNLVEKAWPSFGAIYFYMDTEAKRLKELKLDDRELGEQAKTVITTILHATEYANLTRLMKENNWEATLAHMAITGDAIGLLMQRITSATDRARTIGKKAEKQHKQIIDSLTDSLNADLQFFKSYGNRREIPLKSTEGVRFINAKRKVDALETNLNYYQD